MASYNELLALIDAYINQNGVQAITGQVLNGVLRAMVDQLGRGYAIMGAADPTFDPGTPDGPETWFASVPGTYTNFDGIQIVPGELALLSYEPSTGFSKNTIYEGFQTVQATADDNIGYPQVGVSYANGILSFDFRNIKGEPGENGQDGDPAGFGTVNATVDASVGTPSVTVSSSGPNTAKSFAFSFHNLKGEQGVQGIQGIQGPQGVQGEQGIQGPVGVESCVVTVDNTSGTPSCSVSLVGQVLHLDFTGLKGLQGDTGSSVDYPFTIVNNLTTNDATQALSAAMGVQLESEVSQLEAKVDVLVANMKVLYNALGAGAFWGNKPVIDWGGEDVPVIRNLTHCTCDNEDDSVQIGDSYYAEITPDSGYILGTVLCSMGGTSVSVVNGVIDIDEVTGPITITASGINLDSVAFDGKTYKQIFETNNALGISPGFESGSYSPMTVNAGSPTITTEDADSGTYSLKASGTSSAQLKTGNKSGAAFIACRVKVTSYVQGICGCQFDQNAGVSSITDGWVTKYANRTATSQLVCYVGSFNSANLTGYVDTPVVILKSSFSTVPTFDEFKALYDQYVAIKKAV